MERPGRLFVEGIALPVIESFTIAVGADPTGLKTGLLAASDALKSFSRVANEELKGLASSPETALTGYKYGTDLLEGLKQSFAASASQNREFLFKGILTREEFQERGRTNAAAFNTALISGLSELRGRDLLLPEIEQHLISQLKDDGLKAGDAFVKSVATKVAGAGALTSGGSSSALRRFAESTGGISTALDATGGAFNRLNGRAGTTFNAVAFGFESMVRGAAAGESGARAAFRSVGSFASAFGPGGLVVTALIAGGTAIYEYFENARKEAEKTVKAFKASLASIYEGNNSTALQQQLKDIAKGSASVNAGLTDGVVGGLDSLRKQAAETDKQIDALLTRNSQSFATRALQTAKDIVGVVGPLASGNVAQALTARESADAVIYNRLQDRSKQLAASIKAETDKYNTVLKLLNQPADLPTTGGTLGSVTITGAKKTTALKELRDFRAELAALTGTINEEGLKAFDATGFGEKLAAEYGSALARLKTLPKNGTDALGIQKLIDEANKAFSKALTAPDVGDAISAPLTDALSLHRAITDEIQKQGGLLNAPSALLTQLKDVVKTITAAKANATNTGLSSEAETRQLLAQARAFQQGLSGINITDTLTRLEGLQQKLSAQQFLAPSAAGLSIAPDLKLATLSAEIGKAIEDIQRARGQFKEVDTRRTTTASQDAALDAERTARQDFTREYKQSSTDFLYAQQRLKIEFTDLTDAVTLAARFVGADFLTALRGFTPGGLIEKIGGNLTGALVGGLNSLIDGATSFITNGISELFSGFLGGQTAANREYEATLKSNVDALRKFTDGLRDGTATSGQLVQAQRAAEAYLAIGRQQRTVLEGNVPAPLGSQARAESAAFITNFARDFGLTVTQLTQIADQYGITLVKNGYIVGNAFDALAKTLALVIPKVLSFGEDFNSQDAAKQLRDQLFGKTSNTDTIKRELEELAQFAPQLGKAFDGLDATTQAGRDAIRTALQNLFTAIDTKQLTPEQLGGLSLEDLTTIIRGTNDALGGLTDVANEVSGALRNVPQGFKVAAAAFAAADATLSGLTPRPATNIPLPTPPTYPTSPTNRGQFPTSPMDAAPSVTNNYFNFGAGSVPVDARTMTPDEILKAVAGASQNMALRTTGNVADAPLMLAYAR